MRGLVQQLQYTVLVETISASQARWWIPDAPVMVVPAAAGEAAEEVAVRVLLAMPVQLQPTRVRVWAGRHVDVGCAPDAVAYSDGRLDVGAQRIVGAQVPLSRIIAVHRGRRSSATP